MKRVLSLFLIASLLTGCAHNLTTHVVTTTIERPKLDTKPLPPLDLAPVTWKLLTDNKTTYFALDSENYSRLSNNMELVQDRLFYDQNVITGQQTYYETPPVADQVKPKTSLFGLNN